VLKSGAFKRACAGRADSQFPTRMRTWRSSPGLSRRPVRAAFAGQPQQLQGVVSSTKAVGEPF
jgi:hypothetical protein